MLFVLVVALAQASSPYPAALASQLGMPCTPACTVCHTTNAGGGGTVTRAFGVAAMDRGLDGGGQTPLLLAALDALQTDAVDSDGDGVTDIDALINGDDPNGGPPLCDAVSPQYGCFNHASSAWSLTGAFLTALVLRRRARDQRTTAASSTITP
jgi:hypothetical protein